MKYFNYSKSIITSFLFIFPLFIFYELIAFFKFSNSEFVIRNTADIIFRDIIRYFTDHLLLVQFLLIVLFFTYCIYTSSEKKLYKFKIKYMPLMFIEGFLYGFILVFILNGLDVFTKISFLFYEDYILSFYLCLGAGIWEEILFRFILLNFLLYIFSFILSNNLILLVLSILFSSIVFSLFHYIGSFGELFTFYSFVIRVLGGVYLSIIYYYRGLGIAMFTHFIYDFILVSYPFI